jgi:hypothetical protein
MTAPRGRGRGPLPFHGLKTILEKCTTDINSLFEQHIADLRQHFRRRHVVAAFASHNSNHSVTHLEFARSCHRIAAEKARVMDSSYCLIEGCVPISALFVYAFAPIAPCISQAC